MPALQTSHQQSLTITLPSIPLMGTSTPSAANNLKFTFPLHSSTTSPDHEVNDLRNSLDPKTIPKTHTILTLPPKSTFSTGLHWHETHDEYLYVLQGRALMTLGPITTVVSRDDGVQEIPRGTVHGFSRADSAAVDARTRALYAQKQNNHVHSSDSGSDDWENEDMIILEFTSPADPLKEVMFRNGVSAFLANDSQLSLSLIPKLLVNMGTLDQYPLVVPAGVPGSKWLSWALMHVVFGVSVPVLRWWGVRGWEREWTPRELWGVVEGDDGGEGLRRGAS